MLRQLVAVLFLCFLWFAPGREAHAQSFSGCTDNGGGNYMCDTRSSAYAGASGWTNLVTNSDAVFFCGANAVVTGRRVVYDPPGYRPQWQCTGDTNWRNLSAYFQWTTECPAGQSWDDTAHNCSAPFDSAACLAHNAEPGFINTGDTVRGFECANVGGCEFKAVGPHVAVGDVSNPSGPKVWYGHFEFTGNPGSTCTTNKPTPDPTLDDAKNSKTQECIPIGGMTDCVRADGKHCIETKAGRYSCWGPTEVGTHIDGNILQQRNGGNTPAPPPAPPPGDTLTQTSTGTSSTTTINNTTTSTSTTTTTNFQTGSGSDAGTGGTNDGENNDGSGDGKDSGDHGSASGGVDCHTPPTLTPGDNPLEAHMDNQIWLQRCQGLDGLNPEIDAAKAAVLAQETAWNNSVGSLDPDGFEAYYNAHKSDTPTNAGGSSVIDKSTIDTTGLDATGFLSAGTCPTIPDLHVGPVVVPINFAPICGLLSGFGTLVVALAYFIAAKMIATA